TLTLGVFLDNGLDPEDRIYLRTGAGNTALDVGFRLLTNTPFLAAASLGPLRVEARNVDLTVARRNPSNGQLDPAGDATFSTLLRDPSGSDGITRLSEITANPLGIFQAPALQGIARLSADVAADSGVGSATVPLSVSQRLDFLNSSPTITINTSDLGNLLPSSPADLLSNGTLDETARDLLAQLQPWLTQFANSAGQNPLLDTTIPVLEKTLREILTIDTLLSDFGSALLSFANDPAGAAQSVATAAANQIEALSTSARSFVVDRANMYSGLVDAAATQAAEQLGLQSGSDQFVMQLGTTISIPFLNERGAIGVGDTDLNFALEAGISGNTDVEIKVTLGVRLDPTLPVEEAVFLRLDTFDVDLAADVDPSFDSDVRVGVLDLALEGNSNFSIRAGLSGGVATGLGVPPSPLSLGEVLGTSTDGLLNFQVTRAEISGAFIMTANLSGIGSGTLLVTGQGNPFSGEPVTYLFTGTLADEASEFSGLTGQGFLANLQQVAAWLSSLSGSSFLDTDLPFTDATIGDALDWGAAFEAQVNDVLTDANGFANFDSIEELVQQLGASAGIDPNSITSNYNTGRERLEFELTLTHDFGDLSTGFNVSQGFDGLGGVSSDGSLTVGADGTLQIGFGFDLTRVNVVMEALRVPNLSLPVGE
ncbi:MAG: hypothetical protein HRU31_19085, partial [Rhodobacteraceae bacterium]|nr:hypothetical protein [Paracoccaceae bacterium]